MAPGKDQVQTCALTDYKNDVLPDLILLIKSKPFFNHILGHKELLECNIHTVRETTEKLQAVREGTS